MSEKIPTRFLKLRKLTALARAEFLEGPKPKSLLDDNKRKSFISMLRGRNVNVLASKPLTSTKQCSLSFNVAAWLKVNKSCNQLISLVISYKDSEGEFSIVVDEDLISEDYSLMLSGSVTLNSKGVPEFIRICVAGLNADQNVFVDDLHVEKVKTDSLGFELSHTA